MFTCPDNNRIQKGVSDKNITSHNARYVKLNYGEASRYLICKYLLINML